MNHFRNHFVALIDILGFKDLANNALSDQQQNILISNMVEIHKKFNIEAREVKNLTNITPENHAQQCIGITHLSKDSTIIVPTCTQISDCFVISVDAEKYDNSDCIATLFALIQTIHNELNVMLRGTISYGALFHRQNMILGPAYQKAYEAEQKLAKWPRVICTQSVSDNLDIDTFNKFFTNMPEVTRNEYHMDTTPFLRLSYDHNQINRLRKKFKPESSVVKDLFDYLDYHEQFNNSLIVQDIE